MKQWISYWSIVWLLSPVGGQTSVPICGYPKIHDPKGEVRLRPVELGKALLGDRPFKIRENITSEDLNLIEVEFSELHVADDFVIYGETAELDAGRIPFEAVTSIVQHFGSTTNPGSIDQTRGIKAISEQLFGAPPDIGNTGKVYILLVDVRDDYEADVSESFVAGYFDPLDQSSAGNQADIIYLDTNPGMQAGRDTEQLLNTLAHEYQHLIHYGRDPNEDIWLNEGLSELAPQLMGIASRDFSSYLADTNVRLDKFDGVIADYARCGLFMTYYFHRYGLRAISDLVADTRNGVTSLAYQLERLGEQSLDLYINDWHQANYFGSEAEYPYPDSLGIPRANVHAEIIEFPTTYDEAYVQRFGANWTLISGGTQLLLRASRSSLNIDMQIFPGTSIAIVPPEMFTYGYIDDGFGELYEDLHLLVTGSEALADSGEFGFYTSASGGYKEEVIAYDAGDDVAPDILILLGDGDTLSGGAAVSFDLSAPVYLNNIQFYSSNEEPCEVALTERINDVVPILSKRVAASVAGSWNTVRLPDKPLLQAGTYYVTVTSVTLVMGFTNSRGAQNSYYWAPWEDQYLPVGRFAVDDETLEGNWNIRLSYLMADEGLQIEQTPLFVGNVYPNPISAAQIKSTGIQINLFGDHTSTKVTIYDLLGRQVRSMAGVPTGGLTYITWKGINNQGMPVPSGLYLARVIAGGKSVTRKILVVR